MESTDLQQFIEVITGVDREVDQVLHHLHHLVALLPGARVQALLPPGGLIWTEGELSLNSVAPGLTRVTWPSV